MPTLTLEDAIEVLVTNPYKGSIDVHAEADRMIGTVDVPAQVQRFLTAGAREQAEALILAAGHQQACASGGASAKVLPRTALPDGLRKQLPRPATAYVRIAAAAG